MANWYGAARSNYVTISDMEGLKAAISPFELEIAESSHGSYDPVKFCLLAGEEGWPIWSPDGGIEFDFKTHVMPFVIEGEVLVIMEAGAEKKRYVTGYAGAYVRHGDTVRATFLSLNDIYAQAATAFGIGQDKITFAEY